MSNDGLPNLGFNAPQEIDFGSLFNYGSQDPNKSVFNTQLPNSPENQSFSAGDWAKLGSGALNAWLGYKGLKLGEEQLDFSRSSFNKNLANQAQLINTQLEDRQRARQGFQTGTYGDNPTTNTQYAEDLSKYSEDNKVSGKAI